MSKSAIPRHASENESYASTQMALQLRPAMVDVHL